MTPDERRCLASRLVRKAMTHGGWTVPTLAREAGLDARTVRSITKGERWPSRGVRDRIETTLGLPPDAILTAALGADCDLTTIPTTDLIDELARRAHLLDQARTTPRS